MKRPVGFDKWDTYLYARLNVPPRFPAPSTELSFLISFSSSGSAKVSKFSCKSEQSTSKSLLWKNMILVNLCIINTSLKLMLSCYHQEIFYVHTNKIPKNSLNLGTNRNGISRFRNNDLSIDQCLNFIFSLFQPLAKNQIDFHKSLT